MSEPTSETQERWPGPGVAGIGTASFLAFAYLVAWMLVALVGLYGMRRGPEPERRTA